VKGAGAFAPGQVLGPLAISAVAALAFGIALSILRTPTDLDARLAAVQAETQRTEALLQPTRAPLVPPGSICRQDAETQAAAFQSSVPQLLGAHGLVMISLDARPEPAPELSERLVPVRLRFMATGSYEGALAVLSNLRGEGPRVWVDRLSLTPTPANVTIGFSGRVFCPA